MGNLTKRELLSHVIKLHVIIELINTENCYDKIVKFFQITSELQDRSEEIMKLLPPIEGINFCGWKSAKRKQSENSRMRARIKLDGLLREINKAGRDSFGHNRTKPGEDVTKDNIYFGDVWGIGTFSIRTFEEECKKDTFVQTHIRNQITRFVKSYEDIFNANWLMFWIH